MVKVFFVKNSNTGKVKFDPVYVTKAYRGEAEV